MRKRDRKKIGSAVSDILPWLIIALAVLAILLFSIFIMKGKGFDFIDQIKNLFRGR
jgi:hypothetical protein